MGLQTSIENEPKSSCNSWEDFGILLSLGLLDFDELEARFQREDIQPGYIFQKNSKSLRIFFKDDTGASYLVDVGGSSNMSKALNKVHKMNDVLVKEGLREDLQVSELKGVVLLPNIVTIRLENQEISEAITVTGARARMLLGGNQRQQMGETKGAQEAGYAYLASF